MERTIRNPVTVIVLSLVTCGIYGLYWSWVTNKQINDLLGKEDISGGMMIFSIICCPMLFYVWYKWDLSLVEIAKHEKIDYNSSFILWIVLTFVGGIGWYVASYQIQTALNSVYGDKGGAGNAKQSSTRKGKQGGTRSKKS